MGKQSNLQCGQLWKIFQRPNDCSICQRNLEGRTMSDTVETRSAVPVTNQVSVSPLAGKPAKREILVDVSRLEKAYFERPPDLQDPNQLVSFGTSGHHGCTFTRKFS